MQADTITLAVDVENDETLVNQVYTRSEEYLNRSLYTGPNHTLISRDTLGLYRTMPTKSGNFNGVAKSAAKCTEDISVPGVDSTTTLTAPMIGEVSFSLPVGVTSAQAMAFRQRLVALIDHTITMEALTEKLQV